MGSEMCIRDRCYPGCARHLTPLYISMTPCARSATCKPCPMALVPDSTVHCSRRPARNLDLSLSDHAQGPWVGFIYIQLSMLFKNGPGLPKKRPHYKHTLPRLARSTLNELQQNQHKKASLVCVCTEPVRTGIGAVCVEYGRPN